MNSNKHIDLIVIYDELELDGEVVIAKKMISYGAWATLIDAYPHLTAKEIASLCVSNPR